MRPRPSDLLLLAAGLALGGWFGLVVAALGVVAVRRAPSSAPWLPVALLGLAALATVLGEVPTDGGLRPTYADDRPVAAGAGLAAGIMLLVVLVETAVTGAAAATSATTPIGARREPLARRTSRAHAPAIGAAVGAAVLRLVTGGPVLSGAEESAVAGLRSGDGFPADLPPIAVGLDALAPVGTTVLTALLAGALALATGWLVRRLTDTRTGVAAAVVAAAVPLTWASSLAVTAGLLALTLALAVLAGPAVRVGGAVGGGALLGLATLARPELGLVALAAIAWCALRPRPLTTTRVVAVAAAAVAVTLPWVVHVEHRTDTPGLVGSVGDAIRSVGELSGGIVPEALAVAAVVAAAGAVALRHRWFLRRLVLLLPLVAGAFLALVLLSADPGAAALHPALPMASLALARVVVAELDRRAARR